MHPHQSTDKFFELFDDCQEMIESLGSILALYVIVLAKKTQISRIRQQVDQLRKCSFEFSFIRLNEVFFDFDYRIEKNTDDASYIECVAILIKDLEPAYMDFFSKLRASQSLSSNGYYMQKNNKKRNLI